MFISMKENNKKPKKIKCMCKNEIKKIKCLECQSSKSFVYDSRRGRCDQCLAKIRSIQLDCEECSNDHNKIKPEEFQSSIEFKYGIPMLVLDIAKTLTGYDFLGAYNKDREKFRLIERLSYDNENFHALKAKIPDEMQEYVFRTFSDLG